MPSTFFARANEGNLVSPDCTKCLEGDYHFTEGTGCTELGSYLVYSVRPSVAARSALAHEIKSWHVLERIRFWQLIGKDPFSHLPQSPTSARELSHPIDTNGSWWWERHTPVTGMCAQKHPPISPETFSRATSERNAINCHGTQGINLLLRAGTEQCAVASATSLKHACRKAVFSWQASVLAQTLKP